MLIGRQGSIIISLPIMHYYLILYYINPVNMQIGRQGPITTSLPIMHDY